MVGGLWARISVGCGGQEGRRIEYGTMSGVPAKMRSSSRPLIGTADVARSDVAGEASIWR